MESDSSKEQEILKEHLENKTLFFLKTQKLVRSTLIQGKSWQKNSFVVEVTLKTNNSYYIFYVYKPTTADFSKESPFRDLSKQF